jgi:hypothetical protein
MSIALFPNPRPLVKAAIEYRCHSIAIRTFAGQGCWSWAYWIAEIDCYEESNGFIPTSGHAMAQAVKAALERIDSFT